MVTVFGEGAVKEIKVKNKGKTAAGPNPLWLSPNEEMEIGCTQRMTM